MRGDYYADGVTKITDPFYICICLKGHKYWSITQVKTCDLCGSVLSSCKQPGKKRETA